jgi:hypothetical protein
MLTSRTRRSGRRTVLLCNRKSHYMVGRGHHHSFPKICSQYQGKGKFYTPLFSLLGALNHLSSRFHQTPSDGTPHRSSRWRKYLQYLLSPKCQPSRPTRLKSPQSLLRPSMRRGCRLAGSPSTQLPTTTVQTTSLREEIPGLEALLSSVSRASAISGGRAATRVLFLCPTQALGRPRPRHPKTTPHPLHRPPYPLIHHKVNTLPFLHQELHLALILSWITSDLTRIQNTLFILLKAPRTKRPHKVHPLPQSPLLLLRRRRKTRRGA